MIIVAHDNDNVINKKSINYRKSKINLSKNRNKNIHYLTKK